MFFSCSAELWIHHKKKIITPKKNLPTVQKPIPPFFMMNRLCETVFHASMFI
jgi:hypothetical protein